MTFAFLPPHPFRPARWAWLLAALGLAPGLTAGQALSLPEALRLAASQSLSAHQADAATAIARQDTEQVRSYYLPEVNVSGGHLNLSDRPTLMSPTMSLLGYTIPATPTPLADQASWRYKVSASYLIYDWGRRGQAVKATAARAEAVALGGSEQVRRAQVEVAARYAALLDIQARRRVVDQRLEALEAHLRVVRNLTEHGVVARNDLLRTEVVLRSVQDSGLALDRARTAALERLNIALGADPATPRELPGAPPAAPALPWDEAACRDRAARANEGVQALRAKVGATREQVGLRRKAYAPSLVTEVAHVYEQNSHMQANHENTLYVGLTWNLFDGGARSARLSQARSESSQAERELLDAERQAGAAAAAAWQEVQQTRQEAATAHANVAASLENLRIVGDQYQEGLVRNTDVLDAESVLAESRFSLASKRSRLLAQEAVLLAALGEDLPAFFERKAEPEPTEK